MSRRKTESLVDVIFRYKEGAILFAAFMVGRIPVHAFRVGFYRVVLGMKLASGVKFHWRGVFFGPGGIEIGRNSIIGNDVFLDGRFGLVIGSNVNIGGHVHVYTLEHDPESASFGVKGGKVDIGDFCYIASRATVLPGVVIGRGAVVAAGAVVSRSVPANAIVAGVPARQIGERRSDLDYELNYHLPFQ